ncbi:MAG: MFS transporter [Oscillospiraceae bacterium]|nr:MFS transporter [Oscillospiraceae bacterium]
MKKMKKLTVFTLSALGVFLAAAVFGVVFKGFDYSRYRAWLAMSCRIVTLLSALAFCAGLVAVIYRAAGAAVKAIIAITGFLAAAASYIFFWAIILFAVVPVLVVFTPHSEEIMNVDGRKIIKESYDDAWDSTRREQYFEYNGWFLKGKRLSADEAGCE